MDVGTIIGASAGIAALTQVCWAAWKDHRGGGIRRSSAEAQKATLDALQAEASMPHLQESLRLGNVAENLAIQQKIIDGLVSHTGWQDEQLVEAHQENDDLRRRLAEREEQINELERRLGIAEDSLMEARRIIDHLRSDPERTAP